MATTRPAAHFTDDHTSLSGSLGDFSDSDKPNSPVFGLPSQHSGFRSSDPSAMGNDDDPLDDVASDESPWSPPAWRNAPSAGGWYRHQPYANDFDRTKSLSASRSREPSKGFGEGRKDCEDEDDQDATIAAKVPLPRGSTSPSRNSPARLSASRDRQRSTESSSPEKVGACYEKAEHPDKDGGTPGQSPNNFIRFALRAEVQQRTEPIEAAVSWVRAYYDHALKSWMSLISNVCLAFLLVTSFRVLFRTPTIPPVPDLVKVAGLARSFEPLIFYSEHSARHVGDLQETGVAVWDLGESVRAANMTSTPLIVRELDDLSESLKGLSIEMTKFFASVDGDIDSILITMDWARRELGALDSMASSSFSHAFANVHSILSSVGVLENQSTGLQTPLGKIFTTIFGVTSSQRTHQTLHRTFHHFLGALEESINAELTASTALFALFENIDRQFLNLQRTVIREFDTQERLENEFLSSLWTRMVGANKQALRKYEKNKALLASVRARTTQNKGLLVDHNGRLQAMKGNLETLRKRLMGPLVGRAIAGGEFLGVEEQVRSLEGTYDYLSRQRERQKERMLEVLYGASARRHTIGKEDVAGIEA